MPKGIKGFQKGYKHTEKQKDTMRRIHNGKKLSEEHKNKIIKSHIGKKLSEETKLKISIAHKGKYLGRIPWNKGIGTKTSDAKKLKESKEYKIFRRACFERDDYTCIWCFKKGGILNMDHIKPFALFPELRMALDNVRTLCHDCHKKTDTYGWKFYHRNKKQYGK